MPKEKLAKNAQAQFLKSKKAKEKVYGRDYQENLDTPGHPHKFQRANGVATKQGREVGV